MFLCKLRVVLVLVVELVQLVSRVVLALGTRHDFLETVAHHVFGDDVLIKRNQAKNLQNLLSFTLYFIHGFYRKFKNSQENYT